MACRDSRADRSKRSSSRATCVCSARALATMPRAVRWGLQATTPSVGDVLLRRGGLQAASPARDLLLLLVAGDCSISAKCKGTSLTSAGLSCGWAEMSMMLSWCSGVIICRAPACMAGTLAVGLWGSASALSLESCERDRLSLPLILLLVVSAPAPGCCGVLLV